MSISIRQVIAVNSLSMSRRGSSLFAQGGAAPASGAAPTSAKRQSVVLQPMTGGIGLDFDSDFSDSDDERSPQDQSRPTPPTSSTPAGGANDRPMVGGFAAAAYEAAKAFHYQNKDKKASQSAKHSTRS